MNKQIIDSIKSVIGKPYKYNCFDGSGFDCYTLIYYLYSVLDRQLPKENLAVYNLRNHKKLLTKHLTRFFIPSTFEDREPFDILLFQSTNTIDAHLGMVLDRQRFIHVNFNHTVRIEPFEGNILCGELKKVYKWNSSL